MIESMAMNFFQQGDILMFKESLEAKGLKKISGDLLHKGQNHHHRLKGGKFQIMERDGTRFLRVVKDTKLVHEEHKPIAIAKGDYRMGIVQEYDHFAEESRNVID